MWALNVDHSMLSCGGEASYSCIWNLYFWGKHSVFLLDVSEVLLTRTCSFWQWEIKWLQPLILVSPQNLNGSLWVSVLTLTLYKRTGNYFWGPFKTCVLIQRYSESNWFPKSLGKITYMLLILVCLLSAILTESWSELVEILKLISVEYVISVLEYVIIWPLSI